MQKQIEAKAATQAKADKPTKADNAAKLAAEREANITAMRAIARIKYDGPSLTARRGKNKPLAYYLARVSTRDYQQADSESTRDTSEMLKAFRNLDAANTFCPLQTQSDAGALSRCASLGYLTVAGDRIALTESGLARARAIAAKA